MTSTVRAAWLQRWRRFSLFCAAGELVAGSYNWTTTGPEPGLIVQIVVHPRDSNRMLVIAGFYGQMLFELRTAG
jgi:hypothetical protein